MSGSHGFEQIQAIPLNPHPLRRVLLYLGGKALVIAGTIFMGVFITVLIANQPSRRGLGPPVSPFETSLEAQISLVINKSIQKGLVATDPYGVPDQAQVNALKEELRRKAGLTLPYLPKNLYWTVKALTFDWGKLGNRQGGWGYQRTTAGVTDLFSRYLPNTLLLMATSFLLVFLIGLPVALYLSRNYGKWVDRFFALLSPLSAVPSWVYGIWLLVIFAYELRILPFGGMIDSRTPETLTEYVLTLGRHLILPVAAIVISLLFQAIYTWRTYFFLYSREDYVELAQAKGLPPRMFSNRYLYRPALPYIITSFVTTLIGFWQLSMVVEVVFAWPGLGWLYIKEALPNFWGESMEPGELIIAVGIVVIFAYLLGLSVFLLDIFYVMIDPRIRLFPQASEAQPRPFFQRRGKRPYPWRKKVPEGHEVHAPVHSWRGNFQWSDLLQGVRDGKEKAAGFLERNRRFGKELRKYPSAIFGLVVVILLFLGSIFAVTALPYERVGKEYAGKGMVGRAYLPRTAMPRWVNLFQKTPWLSTLILDQNSKGKAESLKTLENGWVEKTIIYTFDYPYQENPSEIFLYFDPVFKEKPPFVSLEWKSPDGRMLNLKPAIATPGSSYDFASGISSGQILNQHPEWKKWFIAHGFFATPAFNLLFATPGSSEPTPEPGAYQLIIKSLLFEKNSDLNAQLVLLGQVYGLAGTDYARRDLVVPLFWGMPFALIIGLLGTLITTLVAILLPALGVWYGGWVDGFVQRITEINMILPGLTIAVLVNVLFGFNIWIILGFVIVVNSLGSPIKVLRSALLQVKEAPYIEAARSYGVSDLRIITHYLIPRILPVLIPQMVMQIPMFIFWEATLGFFNIRSNYPSWGRIIYDGLANGAMYGSPFWVLEPISLLLITSLGFVLLGSALERILNPRVLDKEPVTGE